MALAGGATAREESLGRTANGAMLAAGLTYAASVHFAMTAYLNPVWEYYGFTYTLPSVREVLLAVVLVTAISLAMPHTFAGAANIVLLGLYIAVFVPTVVVSLLVAEDSFARYGPPLLAFASVFLIACMVPRDRAPQQGAFFTPRLERWMLIAWLAVALYLVAQFHSVMSLPGLDDIYQQRAAGAAPDVLSAYAQTYFSAVLSPILLTIGMVRRRIVWVVAGMIGFILYFMIVASRTTILLPLVMMGLFAVLKSPWPVLRSSALYVAILSVLVVWVVRHEESNRIAALLAQYLVFRTVALPGLMFSQYYDVFTVEGFTWWSHVKGASLIVPQPFLAEHPAWPGLGYIVGDLVYSKPANNHNANLYAADGLAAAGVAGVILIGLAFALWLKLLERSARKWDTTLTTLLLVPLGLTFTNGQFFTALLSFGGAFILLLLWLAKTLAPSAR